MKAMGHHQINRKHDLPAGFARSAHDLLLDDLCVSDTSALIFPCGRQAQVIPAAPLIAAHGEPSVRLALPHQHRGHRDAEAAEKEAIGTSRGSKAALSSKLTRCPPSVSRGSLRTGARDQHIGCPMRPSRCIYPTQKAEVPPGPILRVASDPRYHALDLIYSSASTGFDRLIRA